MATLLYHEAEHTQTARVILHDTWLRIQFSPASGDHADYHYIWLRHNCDHDRHPRTRERVVCISALPEHPRPDRVWLEHHPDLLFIEWNEENRPGPSVYELSWLREHAYAYGLESIPAPLSDVNAVTLQASEDSVNTVNTALASVARHGIAIVKGYGENTEGLITAFASAGLHVRSTHFGYIEDLRTDNTTNRNTDQLGYTDSPVYLHTDQPYLEQPPQYQLLQCMQPADIGGENYFVDGIQALEYLRFHDAGAYDLLTRVPIRFHRKQQAFEKEHISPLVTKAPSFGDVLRYSYFTMAPHQTDFNIMKAWYRAYRQFANLVNAETNQLFAPLSAGDFVLYNNHRMLHARRGFFGNRWMRGIYFDSRNETDIQGK